MTEPTLLQHFQEGRYTLTLNRPERKNALDKTLLTLLLKALQNLPNACRVVVLQHTGDVFCAGLDLLWMKESGQKDLQANLEDAHALWELLDCMEHLAVPLLAGLSGSAFAAGVGLVACCDAVVAIDSSSFCLSEVQLGLIPAVISPFMLRKMTASALRHMVLFSEKLSATKALRQGLLSEVVENSHQIDGVLDLWDQQIALAGPTALQVAKQFLRQLPQLSEAEQKKLSLQALAEIRQSPEAQVGLAAFLEKRKTPWSKQT